MKDIWAEDLSEEKKINKKKIIITIILIVLVVEIITSVGVYYSNRNVREWIDKNILRKEVLQDRVATIDLKGNENANIYAYSKYIGLLDKTKFNIYNGNGNKEKELEVQISNPIFDSANRFLAIAENKGNKLYVIEDKSINWEVDVEGNISQVHINRNGYVAVVIANTIHKTVIKLYDSHGNLKFNYYLSSTRAVDVSISNDNKYMAIAEVDTAGTMIQSSVKIMSIEEAIENQADSLKKTYKAKENKLITNVNYQDKNRLVCMYTDSINLIENETDTELINNENSKAIFQSVDLSNAVCSIEEKASGLFTADSNVTIINTDNKNKKEYIAKSVTKEMYSSGDIIALNLGTEVEFIRTDGWLVKRYVANQEITNIVVSNNLAGIIYRDKIEIINF